MHFSQQLWNFRKIFNNQLIVYLLSRYLQKKKKFIESNIFEIGIKVSTPFYCSCILLEGLVFLVRTKTLSH